MDNNSNTHTEIGRRILSILDTLRELLEAYFKQTDSLSPSFEGE